MGIPVFHAFIRSYKAHERAVLEGVVITQVRGGHARQAEADYRRVLDEVSRALPELPKPWRAPDMARQRLADLVREEPVEEKTGSDAAPAAGRKPPEVFDPGSQGVPAS
jgi:hypothetical protein